MRIVFFGDSICVGQRLSPHRSWVVRIGDALTAIPGGESVIVANASVNGNTTRMALERMPHDVQDEGVDIILVQFGINDCNLWLSDRGLPRVSRNAFEANLEEIIARARAFGARRVFLTTNHPTTKTIRINDTVTAHHHGNAIYNESIRQVVRRDGHATLIDIEAVISARAAAGASIAHFLLPDGIHLNTQGHDLYFDTIYPAIAAAARDLLVDERVFVQ